MSKLTLQGIIQSAKPSTTKQGSPYQVIEVLSFTGLRDSLVSSPVSSLQPQSFTISIWGAKPSDTPISQGIFITNLKSDSSFLSCTLKDFQIQTPSPELLNLLPKVVSKTEFFSTIQSLSSLMSPKDSTTFQTIADRLYLPFSQSTAARTNHHNYLGGLLQHTYELLKLFNSLYSSLPFQVNPFIVSLSCLLHDVGKLKEYTSTFDYKPDFFLLGHPFMGAELAGQLLKEFSYPETLIHHVQHCILAHHGRLEFGSPVLPASPEAFLVAQLDALSGIGVQYSKPQDTKVLGTQIQHYNDLSNL